ncbi:glutamate racemase [Pasteurella bettyae]|uniref:Glutamate racemase n=1 Tax=Pasteurella bettyae CCUG 2042 TaxID=1095749 RepID=I3DH87_9PAST|nr:glutamate racemase [Pasteurella bettyae]EIJ71080.1 glutamate racemase [Pasteurella bettyae CCUG 2042]SUB22234.1 glutamate racemase [Pasteurella bettyae]
MVENQPTILFFDSGVGGFSVYREVKELLPNCHYLYCFDNAFFPFSEKSEELIIQRTLTVCGKINGTYPLDLIVIACNTASTVVLPALRETFSIPIVGTVPAIKPATEISQTKQIGLLATKGTIQRSYVDELIKKYATNCKVEKIGSTKLAEIAEQKLHGHSVDLITLKKELEPWIALDKLDSVILGCTHFPLIKEEIQLCLPQVKYFLDPGYAIAKRVKYLLSTIDIQAKPTNTQNLIFCTKLFELDKTFEYMINLWGFKELIVLNV